MSSVFTLDADGRTDKRRGAEAKAPGVCSSLATQNSNFEPFARNFVIQNPESTLVRAEHNAVALGLSIRNELLRPDDQNFEYNAVVFRIGIGRVVNGVEAQPN